MVTNAEYYALEIMTAFLANSESDCDIKKKYVLKQDSCAGIHCRDCNAKTEEWLNAPYDGDDAPRKRCNIKTRIGMFLDMFPDARVYKHGIPTACVRDVFGEEEQPTCVGLTCSACWNALVVKER